MRYFMSYEEAMFEVERDLVEMGIVNETQSYQNHRFTESEKLLYSTKELVGYGFMICDGNIVEGMRGVAKFYNEDSSVVGRYCAREFLERVGNNPVNPGDAYNYRPGIWIKFLKDGKFDYTYSERIHPNLYKTLDVLKKDLYSRQAMLPIFSQGDLDNAGGKKRIPCSITYQIIVRRSAIGHRLYVVYTMRSCDIYTHLGYDLLLAGMMGQWFQDRLEAINPDCRFPENPYVALNVGSLHAFRKDYEPRGVF